MVLRWEDVRAATLLIVAWFCVDWINTGLLNESLEYAGRLLSGMSSLFVIAAIAYVLVECARLAARQVRAHLGW